ncbi:hypothetical protein PINS_up007043 [Pythium insidiosum]|nr:hypothetical protein PINS_up007043 [Pythium insidiosum]
MATRRSSAPSTPPSSTWTRRDLQRLVAACFPVYSDHTAFTRLWGRLVDACGRSTTDGLQLDDASALLSALELDTPQRLTKHNGCDATALQPPLPIALAASTRERGSLSSESTVGDHTVDELRVSTQSLQLSALSPPTPKASSPPPSASAAVSASSSLSPGVMDEVFATDVLKKSQNWLGRWRTRYLFLRWNELEMCTKNQSVSVSRQHSAGSSLTTGATAAAAAATPPPSSSFSLAPQQRSASLGTVSLPSVDAAASSSSSSSAVRSKRYALHNLISIQLLQLNESDRVKRVAVNLHFKQPTHTPPSSSSSSSASVSSSNSDSNSSSGATGGYTTKSLILSSERGPDAVRRVVRQLATMALLQALMANAPAPRIRMLVQAGASLDGGYASVPNLSSLGLLQMPAVYVLQVAVARHLQLAATSTASTASTESVLHELQGADPRCLLHWPFASRALFASDEYAQPPSARGVAARELLLRLWDATSVAAAIATDAHAWSLLMFLCWQGDLQHVEQHLASLQAAIAAGGRSLVVRYLEHTNGAGDTAIHVAIKAAAAACRASELSSRVGEKIALRLVDAAAAATPTPSRLESSTTDPVAVLLAGDAAGETALHLALKARMWRLVERLLSLEAMDPAASDAFRNNALHLAIKVAAPSRVIAYIVSLGAGLWATPRRTSAVAVASSPRRVAASFVDERERQHNDTPLTLAIKAKRDDVVEFLLSEGRANVHVDGVVWQRAPRSGPGPGSGLGSGPTRTLRDGESPLAVAIQTGQARVASLLLQHSSSIGNGSGSGSDGPPLRRTTCATVLGLAIRCGMYGLAMEMVSRLGNDDQDDESAWRRMWVDPEGGELLVMLALRAQQLELAALLLDAAVKRIDARFVLSWRQDATNATLLHTLCLSALRCSDAMKTQEKAQKEEGNEEEEEDNELDSPTASGKRRGRHRGKSRSDSDLFLELALQATNDHSHSHSHSSGGGGPWSLSSPSSSVVSESESESTRSRAFGLAALESLVCLVLRRLGPHAAPVIMTPGYLSISSSDNSSKPSPRTTCPRAVKEPPSVTGYTPLHLAACGVRPELLALLLAAVARDSSEALATALQLVAASDSSETPLHAALLAGATSNALLLLLLARQQPLDALVDATLRDTGDSLLHLACRFPTRRRESLAGA